MLEYDIENSVQYIVDDINRALLEPYSMPDKAVVFGSVMTFLKKSCCLLYQDMLVGDSDGIILKHKNNVPYYSVLFHGTEEWYGSRVTLRFTKDPDWRVTAEVVHEID